MGSVFHRLSPHSAHHTGTWSRGGPFVSFHKDKEAKGEMGLEYSITSMTPPPKVPTTFQKCHRLLDNECLKKQFKCSVRFWLLLRRHS